MADFEVPNPILNRPFDEPAEYWQMEASKNLAVLVAL